MNFVNFSNVEKHSRAKSIETIGLYLLYNSILSFSQVMLDIREDRAISETLVSKAIKGHAAYSGMQSHFLHFLMIQI